MSAVGVLSLVLLGAVPTVESVVLADGVLLVVARIPGAPRASLRYVVHSGAAADPPGYSGLAHLVEHVVLRGHEGVRQRRLFASARAAGVELNGHTTMDGTVFEADGPRDGVLGLLPDYLSVLTAPALTSRDLAIERGVIGAEAQLGGGAGLDTVVLTLLAPTFRDRATVLGTSASRMQVRAEDIRGFVARHYRPRNVSVVFTGDLGLAEVQRLLEQSTWLAPHADAAPRAPDIDLRTPVESVVGGPVFLQLTGYHVDPQHAPACAGLAELAELRLRAVLDGAADGRVTCGSLRGRHLLLAMTRSVVHTDGDLVDTVAGVLDGLRTVGLSARERTFLQDRARAQVARLGTDPARLAEALVAALTRAPEPPFVVSPGQDLDRGSQRRAVAEVLVPRGLDAAQLLHSARATVVDSRRVRLTVRPY
jgi:hypothetical protein